MRDVLVIGAGLSGLVAARRLAAAGADLLVIEARDRVGGRTWTVDVGGATVDLGGTWMSDGQPRLAALAAELGVATVAARRDGRAVLATPARRRRVPGAGLWAALALRRRMRAIDRLAAVAADPGSAARATEWDRLSVADWVDRQGGSEVVRDWLRLAAELELGADAAEVSLLAFLAALHAGRGLGMAAASGGQGERSFAGGAQELCRRLASDLGDRVRLSTRIAAVDQDRDGVTVRGDGVAERARRVVVAVPPPLAGRLAWTPALPPAAARFAATTAPGGVVKVATVYPRPFWRDDGLSGEAYRTAGSIRAVVDAGQGEQGVLAAFVIGAAARDWAADPVAGLGQVLDELAELFGPQAAEPVAWRAMDWASDPLAAACICTLAPGGLGGGAAWGQAHGRVHWAGTEAARSWPRYLEGAVEAGDRAAAEILAALAGERSRPP